MGVGVEFSSNCVLFAARALLITFLIQAFLLPENASKILSIYASPLLSKCPSKPLESCLFYFDGYQASIPAFNLDHAASDGVISSSYLKDSVTGEFVEVDESGIATILCPRGGSDGSTSSNQFFLNGEKAVLKARSFNNPPKAYFKNQCFVLDVRAARIGSHLNLNLGDRNQAKYPDARRCVVFKTGPSPPASGSCAVAAKPPPPPKKTDQVCPTTCDQPPAKYCDFYFDGYKSVVPVFSLKNLKGDTVLSSFLRSFRLPDSTFVEVDRSGEGKIQPCPGEASRSTGTQFYVTQQKAQLHIRTIQKFPGLPYFANNCIKLSLESLQLPGKNGKGIINLDPNDGNLDYPQNRRCIIFRTVA